MESLQDENTDKPIKPCDTYLETFKDLQKNYFNNFYNVIPFCIALGWKKKKRISPQSTRSDGVRLGIIYQNVQYFKYLYYGICLEVMPELQAFSNKVEDQDERIKIAQEYLNGGLSILQSRLSTELARDRDIIRNTLMGEIFSGEEKGMLAALFS